MIKKIKTCLGTFEIRYINDIGWYISMISSDADLLNSIYDLQLKRRDGEMFPWCTEEQMLEVIKKIKTSKIHVKAYKFGDNNVRFAGNQMYINDQLIYIDDIKAFAARLLDLDNKSSGKLSSNLLNGYNYCILPQIITTLNGREAKGYIKIGCEYYPAQIYRKKFLKILYTHYPELKSTS